MADQLYLSLWFRNFRLGDLPASMVRVLHQARSEGDATGLGTATKVIAASSYPLDWNEAAAYQRAYFPEETEASMPEAAVAEAMEILHDDYAYEFETTWPLWTAESVGGLDPIWREEEHVLRIIGFGPQFDDGAYQQNGHVRVDLGTDTPFLEEEAPLDLESAEKLKENVQRLVDFVTRIEKNCGIENRLLWSESGENLAKKLIARLQKLN